MTIDANATLVRRFCATLNTVLDGRDPSALTEHDLALFDEIMTPNLARDTRQSLIPSARSLWGDHHIEITEVIMQGDRVWARVVTSGGHTGDWRGITPMGKRWTNTGVLFIRIENGMIAEWSAQFDELNLLIQLGATITPPGAERTQWTTLQS